MLVVLVLFGLITQCTSQPPVLDPTGAEGILTGLMGGGPPPGPVIGPGPTPGVFVPAPLGPEMIPPGGMGPGSMGPGGMRPGGPMPTDFRSRNFPLSEIMRMIEGMNNGLFYGTDGRQVIDPAAQPIIMREELIVERDRLLREQEMARARASSASADRPATSGGGTSLTVEFTQAEVNRMIQGMRQGKRYNYKGQEAEANEEALDWNQINALFAQFTPPGGRMSVPFTLQEVQNMIVEMENGRRFNYQGRPASQSEPYLYMAQLVNLHRQLQSNPDARLPVNEYDRPTFTLPDVDNMIGGTNNGNVYNYDGVPAQFGDPILTTQQLQILRDEYLQPGFIINFGVDDPNPQGQGGTSGGASVPTRESNTPSINIGASPGVGNIDPGISTGSDPGSSGLDVSLPSGGLISSGTGSPDTPVSGVDSSTSDSGPGAGMGSTPDLGTLPGGDIGTSSGTDIGSGPDMGNNINLGPGTDSMSGVNVVPGPVPDLNTGGGNDLLTGPSPDMNTGSINNILPDTGTDTTGGSSPEINIGADSTMTAGSNMATDMGIGPSPDIGALPNVGPELPISTGPGMGPEPSISTGPDTGSGPGMSTGSDMGGSPGMSTGPDIGSGTGTSTGPDMGPDPRMSTGPDMGPDRGMSTGPDMGPDPGMSTVPDMGPDPSISTGPDMSSDPGMSTGPNMGPDPGMSTGPDMRPDTGMSTGPDMGPDPSTSTGPDMRADPGMSTGPDMGPDSRMSTGPGMGQDPGMPTGPDMGSGTGTGHGTGSDPGMSTGPDFGSDPSISTGLDVASGPGMSAGPDMGQDPGMSIDPDMGSGPGISTGPDMGPDQGMSTGPDVGAGPGISTGQDMGPDQGMSTGPGMGSSTGMSTGPDLGQDPGMSTGPDMGQDSGMPTGQDMGQDQGMSTGPDMGQDLGTSTGPAMGSGTGTSTGSDMGPDPGMSTGPDMASDPNILTGPDMSSGPGPDMIPDPGMSTGPDMIPDRGTDMGPDPGMATGIGPIPDTISNQGGSGIPDISSPPGSSIVDINPLPAGGDPTIGQPPARPDMRQTHRVMPRFTLEQVDTMLAGTRLGQRYNDQGLIADANEKALDLDYLERLKIRLQELARPAWMQAKMDPAACRAYNCNLPICYVPYKNDCKSYIVCQRTALGTYVAWKMRCAFGSYWGTGKLWTCERVEDLADMGFKCPNDKCRNPNVKTYPDEEEKNCRTYWRCENGMSKPKCCPHGQMFDPNTLSCEFDPEENCRSPCPLRIEGCANVHEVNKTQPFYDGNCRTYWDCEKNNPHPVCCPAGHTYNTLSRKCVADAKCTDSCPPQYSDNVCGKLTGNMKVSSYWLDDGNCRTFMKCFEGDSGEPACCRQQHFYNKTSAQCEKVMDPLDVCNYEICPGYKEECRFKAVATNRLMFFDTDANLPRMCAPGTEFVESICTCNGSVTVKTCKPEVYTVFNDTKNKWHVDNFGDGWISIYGTLPKTNSSTGMTYGTFDGESGMEVWRYDHTEFPSITLKISFQPMSVGSAPEVMLSNCRSVDGNDPSFEISIDPTRSEIQFVGQTATDRAALILPYKPSSWNTYSLLFDGENAVAMIDDTGSGKPDITSTQLRGNILAGIGSLKFGPCVGMRNGFVGYMSEVIFSKCLDDASRERMFKVLSNQNVP